MAILWRGRRVKGARVIFAPYAVDGSSTRHVPWMWVLIMRFILPEFAAVHESVGP